MYNLKIIVTSTRPGRKGPIIADWIYGIAKQNEQFNTELLDLAAINLPFMDEPNHPRLKQYQHQHTKDWSKMIDEADAFIFVSPEYNYSITAPFKNAIDYLHQEWQHKPAGLVTYGGISAGTRCAQMMKQVLTALNVMPLTEAISIPMFTQFINEKGEFTPNDILKTAADLMMKALGRWTESMKTLRQ